MSRYKISMNDARRLQKWALNVSGAERFLKNLPKLPKTKRIKAGLYVDYSIDESELEDDGLDYCTPEIASVWMADINEEVIKLGGVRAYNWETFWLEMGEDCEVDKAENWWELIKEKYQKLIKSRR